jgi:RNA polymerase-binding transcription factor DksA
MSTRLDNRPVATHLATEQVERLRRLLVEEYTDRQARAVELQDPVDLEPDLADLLLARVYEAVDEIEAALARIGDGSYGTCTNCGAPIPFERLEIVPSADRCVACQASLDRAR